MNLAFYCVKTLSRRVYLARDQSAFLFNLSRHSHCSTLRILPLLEHQSLGSNRRLPASSSQMISSHSSSKHKHRSCVRGDPIIFKNGSFSYVRNDTLDGSPQNLGTLLFQLFVFYRASIETIPGCPLRRGAGPCLQLVLMFYQ